MFIAWIACIAFWWIAIACIAFSQNILAPIFKILVVFFWPFLSGPYFVKCWEITPIRTGVKRANKVVPYYSTDIRMYLTVI